MSLRIYSDGVSIGGGPSSPSAIAYIILTHEGKLLKEHSEYVGIKTSNQAEYKALIAALESAINFGNAAACYLDSELVVRQINGQYRISDSKMRTLWRTVVALKEKFKKVSFIHVTRTNKYILRVDEMAKSQLDKTIATIPDQTKEEREQQSNLSSFQSDQPDMKV